MDRICNQSVCMGCQPGPFPDILLRTCTGRGPMPPTAAMPESVALVGVECISEGEQAGTGDHIRVGLFAGGVGIVLI